jgi:protein-tyrosine kinase
VAAILAETDHPQQKEGELVPEFMAVIDRNAHEISSIKGNIYTAAGANIPRLIMVTGCQPGCGKTTSAISVANALSCGTQSRVLLVDTNYRSPKLHYCFNLPARPGLSDCVLQESPISTVTYKTQFPNLLVMTTGTQVKSSLSIFNHKYFVTLLDILRVKFDYVIFDSSSFIGNSENALMVRYFDGVLLVAECESTRRELVEVTQKKIIQSQGKPLGVILNRRKYYIPRSVYRFL